MRWRRVGSSIAAVLIGTAMLVVAVLLGVGGVLVLLSRGWSGTTVGWLLFGTALLGLYFSLSCRLLMLGVCVSDDGVRVRALLRTASFSWDAVLAVRSQRVTVTNPAEQPTSMTARQVCFDLVDGQTVETTVRGTLPGAGRSLWTPAVLSASEFDRVLAQLRHLTSVHHTRGRLHEG